MPFKSNLDLNGIILFIMNYSNKKHLLNKNFLINLYFIDFLERISLVKYIKLIKINISF